MAMKSQPFVGSVLALALVCGQLPTALAAEFPRLKLSSLKPFNRSQPSEDDGPSLQEQLETKVETPLVGDYVNIKGLHLVTLQGVGLVVGLEGTGGDPSPSTLRTALTDDMRRHKVADPNFYLRSPNTAMVVVRAYLPVLVEKGDRFDVEVRLPEESNATSLHGGYLMETYLMEQAVIPGQGVLAGFAFAKAKGPVLITAGEGDAADNAGILGRGRIVGGAISLKERDLSIYLRNDFKTIRNSTRIADAIGERFYAYNKHGLREKLAEPKTDQKIVLKILPRYKDNYPRYLQVVRNIAFREDKVARQVRMQKLEEELKDPPQAERAALQLEAIGPDAIPILRTGLKSKSREVRFHAATALAYLGTPDGLPHLAEAAREEPAFRVFAFAAMAASDDVSANMLLRELMNERSAETRYGAFRALTTMDPDDPFVRGEEMNGEFKLHVLHTTGEPMAHITNRRKAEVVLFGARQQLKPPLALRAGNHILVTAAAGSDTAVLSRFAVGEEDRKKEVSLELADVIRAAAELDAKFPDIAQMLSQAHHQHNLEGRLEIDALPEAGRTYYRPAEETADSEVDHSFAEEPAGEPDAEELTVDGEASITPTDLEQPVVDERPAADIDGGPTSLADSSAPPEDAAAQMPARFDLLRVFRRK
jgi:flagellar basal body P-ring protein FlgI/HEAT repeat protein